MAKSRRRRSSKQVLGGEGIETLWLPIGRGVGSGGGRLLSKSGWKGIKVHDNEIDIERLGRVTHLEIRNIAVRAVGKTLFIEGITKS